MTLVLGPTRTEYPGIWGYGRVIGSPATADISSPFGPRIPIYTPVGWTSDHHGGIDLPAAGGTPILHAGDDGVVTAAGPALTGFGNCAFVRCDSGYTLLYAHMQPGLHVGVGQRVTRGGVIGQVGTTGASTGDHLHFGAMRLDAPRITNVNTWFAKELWINPVDYFADVVTSGTVAVEVEEISPESERMVLEFVENSLKALAANPPEDFAAALVELQNRVTYLRSIL